VRDKVPIKIETRGEQTVKNIARPPANITVVNSPTLLKAVLKALSDSYPSDLPSHERCSSQII